MSPYTWTLTEADVAPVDDPTWPAAPASLKLRYFQLVVKHAIQYKRLDLQQGLDAFGVKFAHLALSTILRRRSITGLALPWNPPLIPAGPLSRTSAWLKGQAFVDHATFWWANGWGRILSYHRSGGPTLPVRDAFGLSPARVRAVRAEGVHWWRGAKQGLPTNIVRHTDVLQQGPDTHTLGSPPSTTDQLRRALRDGRFTGWHTPGDLP